MYPTRVPTYSTEIGTSRSTTGSTFTTAAGGAAVARAASPHPAAVITTSPISETTSSPRMSIMRLLLSSGAGKVNAYTRLLVPCDQRHAEDTPRRTRRRENSVDTLSRRARADDCAPGRPGSSEPIPLLLCAASVGLLERVDRLI